MYLPRLEFEPWSPKFLPTGLLTKQHPRVLINSDFKSDTPAYEYGSKGDGKIEAEDVLTRETL